MKNKASIREACKYHHGPISWPTYLGIIFEDLKLESNLSRCRGRDAKIQRDTSVVKEFQKKFVARIQSYKEPSRDTIHPN